MQLQHPKPLHEVTALGGVQETFRCCTKGHGIVGSRGMVGPDDLGGLFQPQGFYDPVSNSF